MSIRSSNRMSLDAYRAEMKLGPVEPAGKAACAAPAKHKYHAVATDGPDGMGGTRRYPSKREARMAVRLEQEREVGGIRAWLPQVSVIVGHEGGKPTRHIIDALVMVDVRPDGSFVGRWAEAKGADLPRGKSKRLAFERITGCKVEVV